MIQVMRRSRVQAGVCVHVSTHTHVSLYVQYIVYIDRLIMSMGVRLRLWTAATNGPIVHLHVICEHGEKWWDDAAGWGKLLTRPPDLSGSPASRTIWEQVWGMHERNENFILQALRSHLKVIFICRKILRHGASGFISERRRAADFHRS
jgi:hypothetical protein